MERLRNPRPARIFNAASSRAGARGKRPELRQLRVVRPPPGVCYGLTVSGPLALKTMLALLIPETFGPLLPTEHVVALA